jgi:hypothetical protein
VIADNMAAVMDEHGRRLRAGRFDELFGVPQKWGWRPAGTGSRVPGKIPGADPLLAFDPGVPIPSRRQVGKGTAVYLNLDMQDYGSLRGFWPRGANYLDLFRMLLTDAGIDAPVKVTGPHHVKVQRFNGADVQYVALLADEPGRVHVALPRNAHVRDGARDLGMSREFDLNLDSQKPALLELRAR